MFIAELSHELHPCVSISIHNCCPLFHSGFSINIIVCDYCLVSKPQTGWSSVWLWTTGCAIICMVWHSGRNAILYTADSTAEYSRTQLFICSFLVLYLPQRCRMRRRSSVYLYVCSCGSSCPTAETHAQRPNNNVAKLLNMAWNDFIAFLH